MDSADSMERRLLGPGAAFGFRIRGAPQLETLVITGPFHSLSTTMLAETIASLPALRIVVLDGPFSERSIDGNGAAVAALAGGLSLEHIEVRGCHWIHPELDLFAALEPFARMPALRRLVLQDCLTISPHTPAAKQLQVTREAIGRRFLGTRVEVLLLGAGVKTS